MLIHLHYLLDQFGFLLRCRHFVLQIIFKSAFSDFLDEPIGMQVLQAEIEFESTLQQTSSINFHSVSKLSLAHDKKVISAATFPH